MINKFGTQPALISPITLGEPIVVWSFVCGAFGAKNPLRGVLFIFFPPPDVELSGLLYLGSKKTASFNMLSKLRPEKREKKQ